jgi:hypothetical protein
MTEHHHLSEARTQSEHVCLGPCGVPNGSQYRQAEVQSQGCSSLNSQYHCMLVQQLLPVPGMQESHT